MKQAIAVLRFIGISISVLVLVAGVSLGLPVAIALNQVTDAAVVKGWLADSQFYDRMIDISLQETLADMARTTPNVPNLYSPDLSSAYQNAFPIASTQAEFEAMIDLLYADLQGQNTGPLTMTLNFEVTETFLQQGAIAVLDDHVEALPICSGNSRFNALACIPPTTSRTDLMIQIDRYWMQEVVGSFSSLLESIEVDAEVLKPFRRFFRISKQINQYFVLGIMACSTVLIFANRDRAAGLKSAAVCWLVGSLISIGLLLLSGFGSWSLLQSAQIEAGAEAGVAMMTALLQTAYFSILGQVVLASILGVGIGYVGTLAMRRLGKTTG